MNLSHSLLNALKDYGAREVFGIPGDFALPFFRQIETSGILPLFTFSHEPGLGFAADAAGRYRGTLGVAVVTYGAGCLNMINAVANAYAEKSPLVVISGAPGASEADMGLSLHHQVKHLDSQRLVMNEVTCAQCVLDDPRTACAEIARVLSTARHLSRPVYIEFPRDQVEAPANAVEPYQPPVSNSDAAQVAAAETLQLLKNAEKPALLLGVEIRRYGLSDKVAQLAKLLSIPAATSFMGRGILAETDAPLAGTYLGLAGDDSVRKLVEHSDGLLMLGVILCDTNFGVSKRKVDMRNAVHAFDAQVSINYHRYDEVYLTEFVNQLLLQAETIGSATPGSANYDTGMPLDDQLITSRDVALAVNDMFGEYGAMPISSDMGDCLFSALDMQHTEMVAPGYYATMGPGVPAGLGLQIAAEQRTLILVGDGAFQMTGWELGNCRKLGVAPIVIVYNNKAWGMLKAFQGETRYNDLDEWHFADLCEALGGKGRRVQTRAQLAEALHEAQADNSQFRLVEVMLSRSDLSRALSQFTGAIKAHSVLRDSDEEPKMNE
ncbi:MAG: indolepyruvate/phenylpyruvate decarboxylase [Granulosicoccus sp.]